MKRIYLIDCPGIVPPSVTDSPEDILMRGVVRVENVENPAQYVPAVLARCKRHHLERTYDVKGWAGAAAASSIEEENVVGVPRSDKQRTEEAIRFLEALARKGGRLLKGGEADLDGVAKMVLNDFLRGKIPWFSPPPVAEGDGGKRVEGKEDSMEESRDEMLGFTHKKRKRELEDSGVDVGGTEGEQEEAELSESDEDDFKGFDEEDEGSSHTGSDDAGGVELSDGDSEDEAFNDADAP
jgi:nuclear GTP-binding protein